MALKVLALPSGRCYITEYMPNASTRTSKRVRRPAATAVYERIGKPVVFVDVETTGTSARFGKVIEIGAIRVEGGRVVDEMDTLVDPGAPLPRFTISLTGITDDDMAGAPSFREVAGRLYELLKGAVLVAHNVYFDYGFIKAEL